MTVKEKLLQEREVFVRLIASIDAEIGGLSPDISDENVIETIVSEVFGKNCPYDIRWLTVSQLAERCYCSLAHSRGIGRLTMQRLKAILLDHGYKTFAPCKEQNGWCAANRKIAPEDKE